MSIVCNNWKQVDDVIGDEESYWGFQKAMHKFEANSLWVKRRSVLEMFVVFPAVLRSGSRSKKLAQRANSKDNSFACFDFGYSPWMLCVGHLPAEGNLVDVFEQHLH